MNKPTHSQDSQSSPYPDGNRDIQPEDFQPESGDVDRQDRQDIRQSSPTNPRMADKPEVNQEEA